MSRIPLRAEAGFTFIEVMVAVVIVSIAALGLVVGATHAVGELQALELRERAVEELVSYLEYWKGRIADGKVSLTERAGDPVGKEVFLRGEKFSDVAVPARLFYDPITLVPSAYGDNIKRYQIRVWIEWEDYTSTSRRIKKHEELAMVMSQFPK
jgi:prepilin-type N-terminal cleavage/methylation domain-containing protein